MAKTLNFSADYLENMSLRDLLNYKNDIVNQIFEIGTPLNDDETAQLELLSAQCDHVDTLLKLKMHPFSSIFPVR